MNGLQEGQAINYFMPALKRKVAFVDTWEKTMTAGVSKEQVIILPMKRDALHREMD